jgi:hypothetical protein
MNSNRWTCIIALMLFAMLAIPVQLAAQDQRGDLHWHHHYKLIDIGTFGGPQSYTFASFSIENNRILTNRGAFAGFADTSTADPFPNFCFNDCFVNHAFQWQHGEMTDLGALPGGGSSASTFIGGSGLIAGLSRNGKIDPLFSGFPETRAVLWNHGKIRNLGTLEGGYESAAAAVNSQGQVVGGSLNTVPDPNAMILLGGSDFPQIPYQVRAFLWQRGLIPCDENHPAVEGCDYTMVDATAATHERSASGIQKPVTAAPRTGLDFRRPRLTLGPGHSWKSRQGLGTRYLRSSPTAENEGSSSEKTSMQSSSCTSGNVISDYLPDGVELPNIPGGSHCSISSQGLLTGECLGARGGICHEAYDPTRCPPSHKPKTPGSWQCGTFGKYHVDLSTSCTP